MKILVAVLVALAFWLALQYAKRLRPRPEQPPPRPQPSLMSSAEAREILGLTASATDSEVIDAHRRLMQKLHPDKGGSAYLAKQLNEAKRVLLRNPSE